MATTELLNLKGSSWVIPGPTNIGIVEVNGVIYLIDSGNDKESGRKINKVATANNWKIEAIINTHSNADHIGGNSYLQRMTNCRIYSSQVEKAFIESPVIEADFLWGGYTIKDLKNKFFEAKPSSVTDIVEAGSSIADCMEIIGLPGHFHGMIGIRTTDNVLYLGDCMFGEQILAKYKIPYIYDVAEYKTTIEKVRNMEAQYYVLSHGNVEQNISYLAEKNIAIVEEIESRILDIVKTGKSFEEILQRVCNQMDIKLDGGQYALVGNTTRSFLSYLYNTNMVGYEFTDNRMYWFAR